MRHLPLLLAVLAAHLAHAAVVRTLDGKVYEGDLRLDQPGQLTLAPRGASAIRIELANILSAQFKPLSPAADAPPSARWIARDIGQPALPGSSQFAANSLTVRASGADISASNDQFHFVYQQLLGDGHIIARLTSITHTDKLAKAGLMFRGGLDHAAPYAMVLIHPAEGASFQSRPALGAQTSVRRGPAASFPAWLKLVRKGNLFSAYVSSDGQNWDPLATDKAAMGLQAYVGIAVCARNPAALCTATFERVAISASSPNTAQPSPPSKGIVLRNGSILAGQVHSATSSALRLWRDREHAVSIPLADVAAILFAPPRRDLPPGPKPAQTGLLLANGDFLEGDIQGIEEGKVKVSSVLFGLRRIEMSQAASATLRDVVPASTRYELRLADGSLLYCDELSIEKDVLAVDTQSAGILRFPTAELLEIKAGASRFKSLADLKPLNVHRPDPHSPAPAFVLDRTTSGLPMVLAGQPCQRGISLVPGTTLTYNLDGSFRALLLRLGVPDGILPAATVRFVVIADNKEIYRSTDRTSMDDPLLLTLNLTHVKILQIRLEPAPLGDFGASGLIADPSLIK